MMSAKPFAHRSIRSILVPSAVMLVCAAVLSLCPGLCSGAGAVGGAPGDPATTWTEPVTGMEFVLVPGGCYKMGRVPGVEEKLLGEVDQWFMDRHYGNETPRHDVCVEPFWISSYEVTQGQWEAVTGETGKGCERTGRNDMMPANFLSYEDARDFAIELTKTAPDGESFRLPTEAEWEFACRAGADAPFSTGWDITAKDARFNAEHGFGTREKNMGWQRPKTVVPVGSYPPNAYGVYDMHGNVAEWTSTLYAPQPGVEPMFEERDSPRVIKGGSFTDQARDLRCSVRKGAVGRHVSCRIGMRLVRIPPPPQNAVESNAAAE